MAVPDPTPVALAAVTGIAPVIAATIAVLAWLRRDAVGARQFATLMGINAVWTTTYAISLFVPGTGATLFWFRITQATLFLVPVPWLAFAATYAGHRERVTAVRLGLASIVPAAVATAILTNPLHGAMWSDPRLAVVGPLTIPDVALRRPFWAAVPYSYALIAAGYALLGRLLLRSVHVYRRQVLLLLLSGVPPMVGNLVYLTGAGPIPGYDFTALAFVVFGLVVYRALFDYELLDLAPVARAAVVDDLDDAILVLDDDGRIVDANCAAERLLDSADPVGDPLASASPTLYDAVLGSDDDVAEDDVDTDPDADRGSDDDVGGPVDEARTDEIAIEVDDERRYFDARTTTLRDHRGDRRGCSVVLRDVTDRKEREESLRTLQTAARNLMACETREEIARTGVEAAEDAIGLPYVTVWLRDDDRLVPAAHTDAVTDVYDPVPSFAPGEGIVGAVYEDGETGVYGDVHDADAPPLRDAEAPIRGAILVPIGEDGLLALASEDAIAPDDERIRLAELLAQTTRSALARADRERELAAKNDRLETFASVVSHDLRSPLTVASGHLDLARQRVDDESLAIADEALDRMDELIDDLLTLTREGDSVDAMPVPLSDVATDAWSTTDTGDLELRLRDGDATVAADRGRLRELFENLFRNAVEHGSTNPAGESSEDPAGAATVTTVTVGTIAPNGGDRSKRGFYVADDGVGIPEQRREAVFEHGHTTSNEGTGLGLAIVDWIADAHGWDVTMTASESGGARFEVTGVEFV